MSVAAVLEFLQQAQYAALCIDSRNVSKGDVFVALPGLTTDGRNYITQAITNGAAAILYEATAALPNDFPIPALAVTDLNSQIAEIAANYYANPSQSLKVIGVTGTNGKSSTCHYIAQLFTAVELKCGVLGTLGNGLYPHLNVAALTTSDCCTLQHSYHDFLQGGAQYVSMEVSSHALDQGRFGNTQIETAVFTNLSQDHLDYHKTMEAYFMAKTKLFSEFGAKHCVINLDDEYAMRLLALIPKSCKTLTYSTHQSTADVYIQDGILHSPWGNGVFSTQLIGAFNVSNALAAFTAAGLQNIPFATLLTNLQRLKPVIGRMELIGAEVKNAPKVVVDYAHTPDALIKVLQALRAYKPRKLYCVFGCGGDRDRTKRPLMMQAVVANSDELIITRDNPRTEDAMQIVQDMLAGFNLTANITIELDRATAIDSTIARATQDDIVLIAGKGHEDYQIIGTTKLPFSDQLVARKALAHKQNLEGIQHANSI